VLERLASTLVVPLEEIAMNHTHLALTRWAILLIAFCSLSSGQVFAEQVQLNVSMAQPVLHAGKKTTTYLKVGLTGFVMENSRERTPVNVTLVLDRSGSMEGDKLKHAKEAAISAIDRLSANDIVSIVAFDSVVEVLVPATKLTDKRAVHAAIEKIKSAGSTALFAGVSKGAEEIRKFHDRNRVNRVILLTDGQANVGPSSPSELGALGASLRKEGISVTTLGLGLDYNEDLMVMLSGKSDGNHAFIRNPNDLKRIFDGEFGDVLSVVAQEVSIQVQCAEGIRPIRSLGRDVEINGQKIHAQLNQIYSRQEKYILLEVEVPAGDEGQTREVATVNVSYSNMATKTVDKLSSTVSVAFTKSADVVEKSENKKTMVDAILQVANENNKMATLLRDQGKIEEAKKAFEGNGAYISGNNIKYNDTQLKAAEDSNGDAAMNAVLDENWNDQRKLNKTEQNAIIQGQASPAK
jgi:Ca-activated chloride channel family protein